MLFGFLVLATTEEGERPLLGSLDTGGIWQWSERCRNLIMRGQTSVLYNQALHLLGKDKIFRLNPKVPDGLFKLDKLSEEALIGKASHESRHFSPKFYEVFCRHVSP